MANPYNFQIRSSILGDQVTHLAFTATGTSASQTVTKGKPIVTTIVTSGTGVVTVTLKEKWFLFENHTGNIQQATYSAAGACNIELTANNSGGAAKTLVFLVTNAAGAAVNLASGDIVRLSLNMSYEKC